MKRIRSSLKKKMIRLVKHNKLVYKCYYIIVSTFLSLLGLLIKSKAREIVFLCYGGRSYGDNLKPIYERMLKDPRFKKWSFVWGFRDPGIIVLPDKERTKVCKVDSIKFYFHALRAKCWITNTTMQRGLNFRNKGTLYVNTWHGIPLKLIGDDVKSDSAFRASPEKYDLLLAAGTFDAKIVGAALHVNPDRVKITGFPRNDRFNMDHEKIRNEVFNFYNLDKKKKVILYAPTYRDYCKKDNGEFTFDVKLSSKEFYNRLGDDYQMLIRAHGAIEDSSSSATGFVDVTGYPYIEDLMIASDVLVSDYSSAIFDYTLLEKPIICFIYDINRYKVDRGFYVDVEEFLPFKKCYTELELYETIKELDFDKESFLSRELREKCGIVSGNASENAVDEIYKLLRHNSEKTNNANEELK